MLPGRCARAKLKQFTDLPHQTDRIQKFTELTQTRPWDSPLENGKSGKRPWNRLVTCPLLHPKFLGEISQQCMVNAGECELMQYKAQIMPKRTAREPQDSEFDH